MASVKDYVKEIKATLREIDGYIREMGKELHPIIIPSEINPIIQMFYDPVCYIFVM